MPGLQLVSGAAAATIAAQSIHSHDFYH
jgi:hypothetical protein